MPRVSVVITTYNRAQLLQRAIDSIFNQSFRDLELIVVDDGSTDNTREIVGNYYPAVRYLHQENSGFSASRNRGIELARGEYIGFLDDDDILLADTLLREVEVLDRHREVGYAYGQAYFVDSLGCVLGLRKSSVFNDSCIVDGKEQIREMLFTYRIGMSGVMVRHQCFEEGNKFDERLRYIAEDFLLFVQLAKKHYVAYIAEPLVKRLLHSGNQFRHPDPRQAELAYLSILKEIFDDPVLREYFRTLKSRTYFCYYQWIADHAYYARDMRMSRSYLRKALMARPQIVLGRDGLINMYSYFKSFIPEREWQAIRGFRNRLFVSKAAEG